METLFSIEPLKKDQLRESHGRFCTKFQAEVDRKYRLISKVEKENHTLKRQVEYWRRQSEALQNILIKLSHAQDNTHNDIL